MRVLVYAVAVAVDVTVAAHIAHNADCAADVADAAVAVRVDAAVSLLRLSSRTSVAPVTLTAMPRPLAVLSSGTASLQAAH